MQALDPSQPPAIEVRRVGGALVSNAIVALQDGAAAGELGPAVHSARKRLKEARALIRLVQPALGGAQARSHGRAFRDAGRRLSATRDADVTSRIVAALASELSDGPVEHLERIRLELDARREASWTAFLDDRHEIDEVLAQLGELSRRVDTWSLAGLGWAAMGQTIASTYQRARRAFADATDDGDEHRWHEARKRTKDLWYHTDLLREAWPAGLAGQANAVHDLADVLGDMQDVHVVTAMLTEGRGTDWNPAGADALLAAAHDRSRVLREQAARDGRRVYAEKPKAFASRFRVYVREIERGSSARSTA